MSFLDLIRRPLQTFTPLEQKVLGAVGAALDPEARRRFERQVEAVNKVQRLGDAREVNLYRMRRGRPRNDPETAFADRRLEAELARVRFRVPGEDWTRSVTLYLVRGFLFSLVFDPAAGAVLDRDDIDIVDVRLAIDPMRDREPPGPRPPADPGRFTGRLAHWREHYELREISQPLDPGDRRQRIGEIPARLPADYLGLTEQSEGLVVGPWKVYGLAEVYGISLGEAEYQVLAELRDGGVVAVENDTPNLYFIPFDGEESREPLDSFMDEIESRLAPAGTEA